MNNNDRSIAYDETQRREIDLAIERARQMRSELVAYHLRRIAGLFVHGLTSSTTTRSGKPGRIATQHH